MILRSPKLIGVVFLALILTGIWFTYAIFTKKFTDYDRVTLETSKIGLQLPSRADVKVRGVIIGEVLEARPTSGGAVLTLGLYPDKTKGVPRNVTAAIEPKTLFGEKYVALQMPQNPEGRIAPGVRITQTRLSHEVEETLSDLYPLLRTVRPGELNLALNAMATALEGRGELLGKNLVVLDGYLKRINPQLPEIVEDLRLLGTTSDLYADVVPEIATILRNTVKTGETLRGREARLNRLFQDVAAFSDTTRTFLAANEENLIRVNQTGAEITRVLAKYAPEYPCLLGGIVSAAGRQAEAFRGFTLHINLEMIPHQPRGYNVNDKPRYGAKNGPYCGTLPSPPFNQSNPFNNQPNLNDGVDEPTGKGTSRAATPWSEGAWYVGSPAELALVRQLLAAQSGGSPEEVSDLSAILFAPLARGTEVSVR